MDKQEVQHAIDTGFSVLVFSPRHKQAVFATASGKKQRHRKTGYALVLALVLVLFVVTAIAIVHGYLEQIASMEKEHGLFYQWETVDRVKLIDILIEGGGMEPDMRTDRLMSGDLSDEETNDLIVEILADWMDAQPRENIVSFHSIMNTVWGDQTTWTLEQKAWLTQQEIYMGKFSGAESFMHVLPDEKDLPQAQAVRIAKDAITLARGLSADALDAHTLWVDLVARRDLPEKRMWQITFVPGEGMPGRWYDPVLVSAQTGELVEIPEFGIYKPRVMDW